MERSKPADSTALLLALAVLIALALSAAYFRHVASGPRRTDLLTTPSIERTRPIVSAAGQFMTLDPTGRFLVNSITNKPVFITGDAAWSLITQLDDADVDLYLSDRASRGFNYIWCAAADNYYQSNAPKDYYGDSPFDGPDFTNEDAKYWKHVDRVIRRAAAYGITVALDPGFVGLSSPGGYLASYQNSSDDVVTAYGSFLGDRYKGSPNVIWALGGDVDPQTGVVPKLTDLAMGIRAKDKIHLIVAEGHPQASATSTFTGTTWMDLDWLYFHTSNVLAEASSDDDTRSLPLFFGEGWYENEHHTTALQLREQEYWAVLGGAYLGNGGFGNRPIWYFNGGPNVEPGEPSWQSQLASPGSLAQMYLGRLFRSREHWKMVPDKDHSVMTAGYDSRGPLNSAGESLRSLRRGVPYRLGEASSLAARTSDGQTIIAYIPNGDSTSVAIDLKTIIDPQAKANAWWFNPSNGSASRIGVFPATESRRFTPPDANDWVLVIDSASAGLGAPGSKDL